jgi:transcriptional regulator with XRE-family HTH domain
LYFQVVVVELLPGWQSHVIRQKVRHQHFGYLFKHLIERENRKMAKMESMGQRLHYVRTSRGLTLEQLAERAGVSKSFLWEAEHDKTGFGRTKLLRVANVLSASLDFLLRGEPAPQYYKPPAIVIPHILCEMAAEYGLSDKQTLALFEIDQSILSCGCLKRREPNSNDYWCQLYEGVKQFLPGN